MTNKISFEEMIPKGDSMQVLKHFQKEYNFDTDDNLIYFLTTNAEIKNCTSFDQRIKVKFGTSGREDCSFFWRCPSLGALPQIRNTNFEQSSTHVHGATTKLQIRRVSQNWNAGPPSSCPYASRRTKQ